jgi:hypothetical protein
MAWEFEHWDNGKVYLHHDNWRAFRKRIEREGYQGHLHDWNNRRVFLSLYSPADNYHDVAVHDEIVTSTELWMLAFEPFPAFTRTVDDPEGWLPSWNLWANDRDGSESVSLFFCEDMPVYRIVPKFQYTPCFANFRGKFWHVGERKYYGLGVHPPPPKPKPLKKGVLAPRSIYEDFDGGW